MGYNVVILVGGETTGTRFRPLSIKTPKLLYNMAGNSLIGHIVESLVSQLGSEIDNVYLLGFYNDPTKFVNYVKSANEDYTDINFEYLSESSSKGTAGGLYYFRDQIFNPESKGLIYIHGDIICDYPLKALVEFHQQKQSNVTILGVNPLLIPENLKKYLAVKPDDSEPLIKENILSNFGTIISKTKESTIEHYVEKPSSEFTVRFSENYDILINGGIYIFDNCLLDVITKVADSKKEHMLVSDDESELEERFISEDDLTISLELDILRNLPDSHYKFTVFRSNEFWYNLKTPLSALIANNFFLSQYGKNENKFNISPNVSIGKNVIIGTGVRIKNSIIGDNVIIGDNTLIVNSILSKNVRIGSWCRIEGLITPNTISRDIVNTHSDGLKSFQNIVVLCENTNVEQDKFVFSSIVLPYKDLKLDTKYEIVM